MAKVEVGRANVVLTVEEDMVRYYLDRGYNLLDEKGGVAKEATPLNEADFRRAYIAQKEKIKSLEAEIDTLKKELDKKKKSAKSKEE